MAIKITSLTQLLQAIADNQPQVLELQNALLCPYSLTLPPGYALTGVDKDTCSISFNNGDGLGLTANNTVKDLVVMAPASNRAIYTQTGLVDMGTLTLTNLTVMGQVSILMRQGTHQLTLLADNIEVTGCDARHYSEQPQKYGVNVLQGAFTVYNYSSDTDSVLTATLTRITVGRKNAPVLGSGIFIGGFNETAGKVKLVKLTTGAIYSNGMIPYGTANLITAGLFISIGVDANAIINEGEVVTYGVNDMVLDNWGVVDSWTAEQPITSYGTSGIGFVNFGVVTTFIAKQAVTTYGLGARGFNQYDGTVETISFKSIVTHGDGAIGVQISKPIGSLTIDGSITTHGSVGDSLVKGVMTSLPAMAFSVKAGGDIRQLTVTGNLVTHGAHVTTYAVEGGHVRQFSLRGQIIAEGEGANVIVVSEEGTTPLIQLKARNQLA